MITVVCVLTGKKYGFRYVLQLHRMVSKFLPVDHRFLLLTDETTTAPDGIEVINIEHYGLKTWFAKMLIFNREVVGDGKILYIDLDMIIAKSLEPLVNLDINFGICDNFTRINQIRNGGKATWPCQFGSCVMLLGDGFGQFVWDKFWKKPWAYILNAKQFGDQYIIECLTGKCAVVLQDVLPEGYFLHYKDFTEEPDERAAVLVFAGKTKPIDCQIPWIKEKWHE